MKLELDTTEKKLIYLMSYLQALAEQHAKEFNRDVTDVKLELLEGLRKGYSKK